MPELVLANEVFAVVGAAMDVYYRLGRGYLEAVYHEALEIEMGRRGIPFESKRQLIIYYKDQPLKTHYYPDMVCYDQLIVELKVMDRLMPREAAQLIHYLKGTRMRVGVRLNFGSANTLEWKRYVAGWNEEEEQTTKYTNKSVHEEEHEIGS